VLKKLVELGLGVSIVPAVAVEREVAAGTLAAVRLLGLSAQRQVGLLVPTSGALPPAAVAFADIARALLAQGR
jgi:DNA-binding transcriptional LysR family regulator